MLDEEVQEIRVDLDDNVLYDDIKNGGIDNDIDNDVSMTKCFNVNSKPYDTNVELDE